MALLLVPATALAQVARIEVSETAGLRRFGYPVRARVSTLLSPATLRLVADGKPVAAQFTRMDEGAVEIDWAVSLGSMEKRRFLVEQGAPPPISAPMRVEEAADSHVVRYPAGLAFHVPKNLAGLLDAVRTPETEYVSPGSRGLILNGRDGAEHRVIATTARVLKSGPLACLLRFESTEQLPGKRAVNSTVKSTVEMEFPESKSWAEVRWTVDDPDDAVGGLAAELNLRVEGQPLIVDFGAGTMIYATVRNGQPAKMRTNAAGWSIEANGESYAVGKDRRAEGWAHVMDRSRATAVGIAEFADYEGSIEASIENQAGGRLRIRRDRLDGTRKSLNFWLHFVPMPVQIGAATSPQSMMHPLSVRVE